MKLEKHKVIVFGASEGGKNYIKSQIEYEILAIADNDSKKHGTLLSGFQIIPPESICDYDYDFVVIASMYVSQIHKQLIEVLNIPVEKVKIVPKSQLKMSSRPFEDLETAKFARNTLSYLVELFESNNFSYFIDFGTLLGIVRDGDIILWDDDIDFSILATDFNKVLKFFEDNMRKLDIDREVKWSGYVVYTAEGEALNINLNFEPPSSLKVNSFEVNIEIVTFKDGLAIQTFNQVPEHHFLNREYIDFFGGKVSVPFDYIAYLEHTYGNWRQPDKNADFSNYTISLYDSITSYKKPII